jgi:predicted AlkP superfamily phosphohydrolase/phosphomutase
VSSGRTVLIAFDSPALRILERELDAGGMPTLACVVRGGGHVPLVDTQAVFTAASWATLVRGVPPPMHHLAADRVLARGSYRLVDVGGEGAGAPAFWRHVGEAGRRVIVMSPYSGGLEHGVPGLQVVGWGSHDPFAAKTGGARSLPAELIGELDRRFGALGGLRFGDRPPRTHDELAAVARSAAAGIERQRRALCWLLERDDWDLFVGSINDCHPATHELLHLADPEHPAHEPDAPPELRAALGRLYRQADEALGRVLAAAPDDARVYVVSPYDHRPTGHLDTVVGPWLTHTGHFARGAGVPRGTRLRALAAGRRAVRGVLPPRLRERAGRHVPRSRWLGELAYADVDWSATSAFPIPGDGSASIRINVSGRDPAGTVAPGDRLRVVAELAHALSELRDADTGLPVVERAVAVDELWGCEPSGPLPDLCVQWRAVQPRAVRCPDGQELAVDATSASCSVHAPPGFLIGAGPGIAASGSPAFAGDPARLIDVAPTVLASLGLDASDLPGERILRLLP